ncbi:MAG: hypothetical protein K0R90_684 [Oscillospiraceae bacterium]|nr:hypothetical protein [Oscillospiraceae bacterium]
MEKKKKMTLTKLVIYAVLVIVVIVLYASYKNTTSPHKSDVFGVNLQAFSMTSLSGGDQMVVVGRYIKDGINDENQNLDYNVNLPQNKDDICGFIKFYDTKGRMTKIVPYHHEGYNAEFYDVDVLDYGNFVVYGLEENRQSNKYEYLKIQYDSEGNIVKTEKSQENLNLYDINDKLIRNYDQNFSGLASRRLTEKTTISGNNEKGYFSYRLLKQGEKGYSTYKAEFFKDKGGYEMTSKILDVTDYPLKYGIWIVIIIVPIVFILGIVTFIVAITRVNLSRRKDLITAQQMVEQNRIEQESLQQSEQNEE